MNINLELLRLPYQSEQMPLVQNDEIPCEFPYYYKFNIPTRYALEFNMHWLEETHTLNLQTLLANAANTESSAIFEPYPESFTFDCLDTVLCFMENRLIAEAAAAPLGYTFPPAGVESRDKFMKQLRVMKLREVPARVCEYFQI